MEDSKAEKEIRYKFPFIIIIFLKFAPLLGSI